MNFPAYFRLFSFFSTHFHDAEVNIRHPAITWTVFACCFQGKQLIVLMSENVTSQMEKELETLSPVSVSFEVKPKLQDPVTEL